MVWYSTFKGSHRGLDIVVSRHTLAHESQVVCRGAVFHGQELLSNVSCLQSSNCRPGPGARGEVSSEASSRHPCQVLVTSYHAVDELRQALGLALELE